MQRTGCGGSDSTGTARPWAGSSLPVPAETRRSRFRQYILFHEKAEPETVQYDGLGEARLVERERTGYINSGDLGVPFEMPREDRPVWQADADTRVLMKVCWR